MRIVEKQPPPSFFAPHPAPSAAKSRFMWNDPVRVGRGKRRDRTAQAGTRPDLRVLTEYQAVDLHHPPDAP